MKLTLRLYNKRMADLVEILNRADAILFDCNSTEYSKKLAAANKANVEMSIRTLEIRGMRELGLKTKN